MPPTEPYVRRMEIGGEQHDRPTWPQVQRAIAGLRERSGIEVFLEGGTLALMIVCFAPPYGFYVVAREEEESGESVLMETGTADGEECVEALIGGNPDLVPRRYLVEESLAMIAAGAFHATGKRLGALAWGSPYET